MSDVSVDAVSKFSPIFSFFVLAETYRLRGQGQAEDGCEGGRHIDARCVRSTDVELGTHARCVETNETPRCGDVRSGIQPINACRRFWRCPTRRARCQLVSSKKEDAKVPTVILPHNVSLTSLSF